MKLRVFFNHVLALKVCTKIAYGMFTSGYTALALTNSSNHTTFPAQNWDWQTEKSTTPTAYAFTSPLDQPSI
jgi:hypothetical protein